MLCLLLLSCLLVPLSLALPARTSSPTKVSLEPRDNWSVTRNDLEDNPCAPVTVIFARGTIELGNVGSLAGPPFFNALANIIGDGNLNVQGVDYPATIAGYLEGGDPAGAATLASLVNLATTKCPNTQIVLSGYRYGNPLSLGQPFIHSPTLLCLLTLSVRFPAKEHKSST